MTVQELIEELEEFPPDMPIFVQDSNKLFPPQPKIEGGKVVL